MGDLISVLTDNRDEFLAGFWVTVRLVVFSFVIAMVVGTLVAALRIAPTRCCSGSAACTSRRSATSPLLVLLFISFAGLRRAGRGHRPVGRRASRSLGLYTAAYVAEALRSGVFSVSKGQIEAALSLGYTYRQTLRRVVFPQAFRTVISPLGSLIIAMIKNSAIIGVSLLALPDLLKSGAHDPVAHVRDQRGLLLGGRRLPDPDRRRHARRSARSRSATRSTDELRLRPRQLGVAGHRQQRPVHPRRAARQPRDRGHLDGAVADRRAGARAAAAVALEAAQRRGRRRGSTCGATCR